MSGQRIKPLRKRFANWQSFKSTLNAKEKMACFEVVLELCAKRPGLTLHDVDFMTLPELQSLIHEERLTLQAPEVLRLPGVDPLPPLVPEVEEESELVATMPLLARSILVDFLLGQKVDTQKHTAMLHALEERGMVENLQDAFGEDWQITEYGAHIAALLNESAKTQREIP